MLDALQEQRFLKGPVFHVTAVRVENLSTGPSNTKYVLYCSMLVWSGSSKLGYGISKMVRHITRLSHCTVEHLLDILIHFQKGVSVFKLIGFHIRSACLLQLNNTIY